MHKTQPIDVELEELSKKKTKIDAQIAALDARRHLSQKKDEDRLKWLLGNLVFDRLNADPVLQNIVRRDLPERFTQRDHNRGLWQILFPEQ
ncbi:hypothetical protein KHQ08_17825 (plasmid) [Pseudochrobactrum algeriensis]|uniref:hypothetical protein n=1 Tax=Pseudochrobactrum algeriensis TaxID=2834768 RepID=UPI001BCBEDF5|nr:hypothetical protein [Pseudochrobactrum algeriensis]QVQ38613.1 hypothetical protein KHQ08_17825 [Pseudochrobactrum algeriensis]QVQ38742.1 hypothetical protein KHQ07_00055 [Pseudochrobactrum algeriensis]QVQ42285.1 hypothetical protein KHQ09_00160 [Pseudochrobactrum algeriensis]